METTPPPPPEDRTSGPHPRHPSADPPCETSSWKLSSPWDSPPRAVGCPRTTHAHPPWEFPTPPPPGDLGCCGECTHRPRVRVPRRKAEPGAFSRLGTATSHPVSRALPPRELPARAWGTTPKQAGADPLLAGRVCVGQALGAAGANYLSPLPRQPGSGATLRAVSRGNYLSQMRLSWLWEMRKGKYDGQILKWFRAGSSSEGTRAWLANLSPGQQRGAQGRVAGPGAAWSSAAPAV